MNFYNYNRNFHPELAYQLNDLQAATIINQLHYWLEKESVGTFIDGVKYIYNTFEDWVKEQFKWLSSWKFRKHMKRLRELGIVLVTRHRACEWNQTNYYTIDYERLNEFMGGNYFTSKYARKAADKSSKKSTAKTAQTTENSEMCDPTDRDVRNYDLEMIKSHTSYIDTKNTNIKKETAKQLRRDRQKIKLEDGVAASSTNSFRKCDLNQEKGSNHSSVPKPKPNGQKFHLNNNPVDNRKTVEEETKAPKVEEKINKTHKRKVEVKIVNQKWQEHLKQLDCLGVEDNATIKSVVKSYTTEQVEIAIAVYKQRKRDAGYIENANGYFVQILKEGWGNKKQASEEEATVESQENDTAKFRYWYELAKELGYCTGVEERTNAETQEAERYVCLTGTWERYVDAVNRGYTLEYLRKVKKRNSR